MALLAAKCLRMKDIKDTNSYGSWVAMVNGTAMCQKPGGGTREPQRGPNELPTEHERVAMYPLGAMLIAVCLGTEFVEVLTPRPL